MQNLKENIIQLGVPFLNKYSDWEDAAYRLVEKEIYHDKACDLFLIATNNEKAYWALQEGLECLEHKPLSSFTNKEQVLLRLKKHFGY